MLRQEDVMQLLLAGGVAVFYFLMFFLIGIFYMRGLKKEKFSVSLVIIAGIFTFFSFFEMLALPMKILGLPLHKLSYTWLGCLMVIGVFSFIYNYSYAKSNIKSWITEKKNEKRIWFFMAILLGVQFFLILRNTAVYMGVRDDYYYIGDICTSIFKDSIQQYSHYTGQKMGGFDNSHFLSMYPMQSAAVCQITGLHPIIENKWSFLLVILAGSNMVYYQLAQIVFPDQDKKKIIGVLVMCTIISYNLQSYGVTTGIFYFYRLSEGKGILANLILPCMVYYFARIIRDCNNKVNWLMMFVLICSSYSIAMSAVFLVPVSLAGMFVGFLMVKKQWKYCLPVGVCFIPCVIVMCLQFMIRFGYLSIAIK